MAEENKEVLELTQQELSEQNRIRREKLAHTTLLSCPMCASLLQAQILRL